MGNMAGTRISLLWLALSAVSGLTFAATKADIDPYLGKVSDSNVKGSGSSYASKVNNGHYLADFDFATGRFKTLSADSVYRNPFTGADFDHPQPTRYAPPANADTSMAHLDRLRNIALALYNNGWTNPATIDSAKRVLIAGMDYWGKVNPYSFLDSTGAERYDSILTVDASGVKHYNLLASGSSWYTRLFTEDGLVSDIALAGRNIVPQGDLSIWVRAIEDTLDNASIPSRMLDILGAHHTAIQGVNWWWRLNPRVMRAYVLGRYGRCDTLLNAADDSLKVVVPPLGVRNYDLSGMRPDGSFNQHGIPYDGHYGYSFMKEATKFGSNANGSPYSIGAAGWAVLIDHMLDGSMRLSYKGLFAPDVDGRYFTQDYLNGRRYAHALDGQIATMALQGYRSDELDSARTWESGGNFPWDEKPTKVFPFADAATMIHSSAAVFWKGTSNRLTRTESYESGDGTYNPFVLDQGMGTHWIMANGGNQYTGHFLAVMDYSLFPGVTADSMNVDTLVSTPGLPSTGGGRIYGTTAFVGGVDDGNRAVIALDYDMAFQHGKTDKGNFTAKKSFFMLDSVLVCLVAGLKFNEPSPVRTGINQLHRLGSFLVSKGGSTTDLALAGKLSGTDIRWAWHDSVGYVFSQGSTVTAQSDTRSAADTLVGWNHATLDTLTVASLWLSHGLKNVNVAGDSFSYAIYPGISRTRFASLADSARTGKIWTQDVNSDSVQAISVSKQDWHGAVFHKAASANLQGALRVKASRPCALMLRLTADSLFLRVSDPAQLTTPVTISVNRQLQGVTWDAANTWSNLNIAIPTTRDSAGCAVVKAWKLTVETPVAIKAKRVEDSEIHHGGHDLLGRYREP